MLDRKRVQARGERPGVCDPKGVERSRDALAPREAEDNLCVNPCATPRIVRDAATLWASPT